MLIESLAAAGMMLILAGAVMLWRAFAGGHSMPTVFDERLLDELLARSGSTGQALKLGSALITLGAALQPPMLLFG